MGIITKLGDTNKGKRVAVWVDQEFICFLNDFTVYKNKLAEGGQIAIADLEKMQFESEKDTAFNLALKHLSKYSKTEKQLREFLRDKGYLPKLCDEVLEKVREYQYVDDRRFAENFVSSSKNKFGSARLKMMLQQKGVGEEIIREALENLDNAGAVQEICKNYMKKKEKTVQNWQKCANYLYGRGFSWQQISAALSELKKEKEDESWE